MIDQVATPDLVPGFSVNGKRVAPTVRLENDRATMASRASGSYFLDFTAKGPAPPPAPLCNVAIGQISQLHRLRTRDLRLAGAGRNDGWHRHADPSVRQRFAAPSRRNRQCWTPSRRIFRCCLAMPASRSQARHGAWRRAAPRRNTPGRTRRAAWIPHRHWWRCR